MAKYQRRVARLIHIVIAVSIATGILGVTVRLSVPHAKTSVTWHTARER